ncbi:MAG: helix-hairpin-helix domain-containing protein [Anderseniella sp.]
MPEIVEITGIGPTLATACAEAGFSRVDEIAGAAPAELAIVPGIGESRAVILISAAQSLLNGAQDPTAEEAARAKPEKAGKQAKAKSKQSKKDKKNRKKGKKNKDKKKNKKNGKSKKSSKKKNSKSKKKK